MLMDKITTLFVGLMLWSSTIYATDCQFAYQNATYGFQHAETAMDANNIDHLKEYAQRSLEAIERTLASTEKCGCTDANDASYNAIEYLYKALEKDKYENIRFFVEKAKKDAKNILISLDLCSENDPISALEIQEGSLQEQEQQLLEQQKQLQEQQNKLAVQLEEQKRLQAEISSQKAAMLIAQKEIKTSSEATLKELELLINQFTSSMGCKNETSLTKESFVKSVDQLEKESLENTKVFYANKAQEMANAMINRLAGCEWKKN